MRHLLHTMMGGVVVAGLSVGLGLVSPTATAHGKSQAGSSHRAHIVPADRADGRTGSQLLAETWTHIYRIHTSEPQPNCSYAGRTDHVLIAGSAAEVCRVKRGYPVMYFFGSTCDPISPEPWYAVGRREQRRCALKFDRSFIVGMHLRVDHGRNLNLRRARFELFTGQRHVVVPVDNIWGEAAGPTTFTAHAWGAFVEHLALGEHTTVLTSDFSDGSRNVETRTIRVIH